RLADQVDAREQVAPLVVAAGLQRDPVPAVELVEVDALEDLVAELGEADALLRVEAARDRVLRQHRAQAVVLADVAQEVDRRQARDPVEVVDDARGVLPLEVEEPRDLALEALGPLRDGLLGVEHAYAGSAG